VISKSPSSSVVRFRWPSHHRLRSRHLSALSSDPALLKTSTSTLHHANILKNRPRSYSTAHQFSYQPYTRYTIDIPQRHSQHLPLNTRSSALSHIPACRPRHIATHYHVLLSRTEFSRWPASAWRGLWSSAAAELWPASRISSAAIPTVSCAGSPPRS